MRGKVLTYNDEKKFGFVKGQDGKKYFFHSDDWMLKESPRKGFIIEFETKDATKGPKAIGIKEVFANNEKPIRSQKKNVVQKSYELPKNFVVSKTDKPKFGKLMAKGEKQIYAESSSSPDEAKAILFNKIQSVGGNAVINFRYDKRTGSSGNYRYTIHRFVGVPAFVLETKKKPKIYAKELKDYDKTIESFKNSVETINSHKEMNGNIMSVLSFIVVVCIFFILIA